MYLHQNTCTWHVHTLVFTCKQTERQNCTCQLLLLKVLHHYIFCFTTTMPSMFGPQGGNSDGKLQLNSRSWIGKGEKQKDQTDQEGSRNKKIQKFLYHKKGLNNESQSNIQAQCFIIQLRQIEVKSVPSSFNHKINAKQVRDIYTFLKNHSAEEYCKH